jgi:hypothetical protein
LLSIERLSFEERALIAKTFGALEARGVLPLFAADWRAALATILLLIPQGAAVAQGSLSGVADVELAAYLKRRDSGYRYLNAEWQAEDPSNSDCQARLRAWQWREADYFLASPAVVCGTGELIRDDAGDDWEAAYISGAQQLVWVAGLNRVAPSLDEGLSRARRPSQCHAVTRLRTNSPAVTQEGRLVIMHQDERPGRVTLILTGESQRRWH